jgi:outer membrane protein assembly factor BamB
MFRFLTPALLAALTGLPAGAADPTRGDREWATYRGNPQRTGNTDGKPGPARPRVLWAMKSRDHFIASLVPHDQRLFASGLGFVNTSNFYCLDTTPAAKKRVLWSKTAPFLQFATVSSPGIAGGKLVFGDGMHQTDGATLYCLSVDRGDPVWRLPVPGKLVHLEGSPTITGGKVYLGGGAAGVLCVDLGRVTLDGKEMGLAAVARLIQTKRKELQAKYEAAKKKDPFAVPPTDNDLPRPAPVKLWQKGAGAWHVDAPVAVVGDRVLVGSAFLDKEKEGRRAVLCLEAKTGKELWSTPLPLNPWGGPSVQGDLVVVSGSTVGYDLKLLKGARGSLTALDLATGKLKWKKELPGGVIGCAALSKDLAVVTATDGKVRAYSLATGALKWFHDARAPFFAAAALSGDTAHVADLRGVVHALNLKTGVLRWKLELGSDPAVSAPGGVYAGPVLQDGRLYLATNNMAGDLVNKPTVIVCIGEK